jgi:hypothetical protein
MAKNLLKIASLEAKKRIKRIKTTRRRNKSQEPGMEGPIVALLLEVARLYLLWLAIYSSTASYAGITH